MDLNDKGDTLEIRDIFFHISSELRTSVDGLVFPGDGGGERLRGRGLRVDVHLVDEEEGEPAVARDPLAEELVHPLQDEGPGRVLQVIGAGNATAALNGTKLKM